MGEPYTSFEVDKQVIAEDGTILLRLASGQGWVFDRKDDDVMCVPVEQYEDFAFSSFRNPEAPPVSPLTASRDDVDDDFWEDDEVDIFHRAVARHTMCWTEEPVPEITTEDLLSRAPDLDTFWFFERRERMAFLEVQDPEPLETVDEYPLEWSQWRIDSFEQRQAMKRDRHQHDISGHSLTAWGKCTNSTSWSASSFELT